MRNNPLSIEELVLSIEHHQSAGEYDRGYKCSKKLLTIIEDPGVDAETLCRALFVASRTAYYVSRFDECLDHLGRFERMIPHVGADQRRPLVAGAALVRANVFRRLGRYEEAILSLAEAGDGEFSALKAERLLVEGACRYYLHDKGSAEELLDVALGIATHLSNPAIQARVLAMKGLLNQSKGHLGSAEEYLVRANALCHSISDAYGEACAGLNLGIVLYRRGKFDEAQASIERARCVFGRIAWTLGEARCLLARGNIDKFRRKFAGASRSYRKALKIARSRGFAREESLSCEYLGEIAADRGEHEKALAYYRESLRIAEGIGPARDIETEVYRRLGELYVRRGDPVRALEHLEKALAAAREIGERFEEGVVLRAMGEALTLSGEENRARRCFEEALDILRPVGCRFEIAKTHLFSVECLAMGKDLRSRNGAISVRNITRDRLGGAWADLVEASHLFAETGSAYWKERTNRLLSRLSVFRRQQAVSTEGCTVVDAHIRLEHRSEYVPCEGFVCVSEPMHRILAQAEFSAGCSRPVLITGETGTGKEVVARLIHSMSARANKAFVAVNCAAIPDHLFESEFFGHRRGCFTGAVTDRKGIFEEADGGTLFLDEIGELTTLQQVKLLRVLQEKTIRRIGDNIERAVDIRIITATNQDIEEKMGNAEFREDFFYRINAEQISIPPLRERPEDIIPLITYYLCGEDRSDRNFVLMESEALRCLQRHRWPGNVRELFNLLGRLRDLSNGEAIRCEMLPEVLRNRRCSHSEGPARRRSPEGGYSGRLEKALAICAGNKSAAARFLGISRGTLYKELKRNGLHEYIRDQRVS